MFGAVLLACITFVHDGSTECRVIANKQVWPTREVCEENLLIIVQNTYAAVNARNDITIDIDGRCFKFDRKV